MSLFDNLSSEQEKRAVWNKGHVVAGYDPNQIRKDDFGTFMQYSQYGNRNSEHGWEIDHKHPTGLGGLDIYANKRPLNWKNNVSLGSLVAALRRN